ncbi:HNRNPLL [Cordylochernes scorpioides]|uniref:HNRNPLL n=1 Tax=Cordylochernes scorpioides TaxID=51811 RepID=A0ABY6L1H2_9ARAC|nr:HNRNPLL [Cordylochernes scorpioides]
MSGYDGHTPKRQRTDMDGRSYGEPTYYNDSGSFQSSGPVKMERVRNTEDEKPNHILLMTIMNPAYPITVDVINTICTPNGKVLRIVIFKKNGVQAMVEYPLMGLLCLYNKWVIDSLTGSAATFDSPESAKRAKDSLNGADIYSGCCTLKIEYAKPNRLNVYKNDMESWDYTNPALGEADQQQTGQNNHANPTTTLSKSHKSNTMKTQQDHYHGLQKMCHLSVLCDGFYQDNTSMNGPPKKRRLEDQYDYHSQRNYVRAGDPAAQPYGTMGDDGGYNGGYGDQHYGGERYDAYRPDPHGPDGPPGRPSAPAYGMGGPGPTPQTMNQGSVMMVYGLNQEKMNCDRLFNLFCLYGNVVRIKFLKSKEGCAMVQMGDPVSVERCISNLNHSFFFNSKMQLGFSKQAFLNDVMQPYELPDGSPSFKDYMGNRNNRFTNPEAASKNRIQAPSKVLHFFNTPPAITEDEMKKHFENEGAPAPVTVKLFPSKSEKSSSGLLQFEEVAPALEALVLCNHMSINNPNGRYPYILKLCFSSSGARF